MKRDYRQTNSSGHGAMNLLRELAVMRISMGVALASNYKCRLCRFLRGKEKDASTAGI